MRQRLAGKPRVFLGSSTRAYGLVKWLAEQIRSHELAIPIEWMSGGFAPSKSILQNLIDQCKTCDFAVIFFTRDDEKSSKDESTYSLSKEYKGPRDNTIFEAGLFVGGLGLQPERCILVSSVEQSTLPSDLKGVTYIKIEEPPPPDPPYNALSDDWCWHHLQNVLESVVFSVNKYGELLYRPRLKVLTKMQLAEREQVGKNCLEKYDRVVINSSEPEDCCDFLLAQMVSQNIKDHIYYDFHFLLGEDNWRNVASQWIDLLRILLATYCIGDESYSEGDLKRDVDINKLLQSKMNDPLYTEALKQFKKQLRFYIHKSKELVPFRMTVHNVSSYEKARCYLRFGDDYVEWFFKEEARVATEVLRKDRKRKELDRDNSVFQDTDTFCIYKPPCYNGNKIQLGLDDIRLVVEEVCEKKFKGLCDNTEGYLYTMEGNRQLYSDYCKQKNLSDLIMQNLENRAFTINTSRIDEGKNLREILMKKIERIFPENMRDNIRGLCFGDDPEIKSEWSHCIKDSTKSKVSKTILDVIDTFKIDENSFSQDVIDAIKNLSDEALIPVYYEHDKKSYIIKKDILEQIIEAMEDKEIRKLQGFMDSIIDKAIKEDSFCTIRESMNLYLVNDLLHALPRVQYLLVSKNGNKDEQVLGCISREDFVKALGHL